jgi:sortase B
MKTEKMTKEKAKRPIYKLFTTILVIALVVVLGVLGYSQMVQRKALQEYEDLAEEVNRIPSASAGTSEASLTEGDTASTEETEVVEENTDPDWDIPEKNLDWTKLEQVNADIYAWIYIPGTKIDYPILQYAGDDSHYLHYNMNGTRGYPGCIYTEKQNQTDFTDFDTVLYGHNMRNQSMFATLHYFEDSPYVYIYTKERVLVYEIYTAYIADDAHILNTNDFSTEIGRQQYLEQMKKYGTDNAKLREDISLTTDSHILTLSTCVSGQAKNRFLVQAVLQNEDEL